MRVKKAIIPAAGLGTRFLPATKAQPKEMLPIVDKPTIQYIVEEAQNSGISDILIITGKGKNSIEDHFDKSRELEWQLERKGKSDLLKKVDKITEGVNIHYIRQKEAKGLANAIHLAKSFVGQDPFAVMLGDIVTDYKYPFLRVLVEMFGKYGAPIIGVSEVKMSEVSNYGIVAASAQSDGMLKISDLVEKPSYDAAPSNMAIMGRYILTPEIFNIIQNIDVGKDGEYQLTDALKVLLKIRPMYACQFKGKIYDIGSKLGFLQANIDFALKQDDLRDGLLKYMLKKVESMEKDSQEIMI
ncbi:MAG: UTP--glucose-1-phosphate uridylyltransferase GalU [Clostridiales bacterium]|nr:UTP--glucose-1-phosphate uridylyltransferase GalU [Clostridiales bacterium]